MKFWICIFFMFIFCSTMAQDGHDSDSCKYEYEVRAAYEADSLADAVMDTMNVIIHSWVNDDSTGGAITATEIQEIIDTINAEFNLVYVHVKHTYVIHRSTALKTFFGSYGHSTETANKLQASLFSLNAEDHYNWCVGGGTYEGLFAYDADTNETWKYYSRAFGTSHHTTLHEFGHLMGMTHTNTGITPEPDCAGDWLAYDNPVREPPHWWAGADDSAANYQGDYFSSTKASPGYTEDDTMCYSIDSCENCTDSAFAGGTWTNYMVASPAGDKDGIVFTYQQRAQIRCMLSNHPYLYECMIWCE